MAYKTHGMTKTREYAAWRGLKQRCLNPKDKSYYRYGGRGITVCQEWIDSFETFYRDMGPKPKGMSIDRINTLEGYSPENCRWATIQEQQRNMRSSKIWFIKGKKFNYYGVGINIIYRWVYGGYESTRNVRRKPKPDCYAVQKY